MDFENKKDREELEEKLSAEYDKALKHEAWDAILQINALIEKIWLEDDKQGYCDPPMREALMSLITNEDLERINQAKKQNKKIDDYCDI